MSSDERYNFLEREIQSQIIKEVSVNKYYLSYRRDATRGEDVEIDDAAEKTIASDLYDILSGRSEKEGFDYAVLRADQKDTFLEDYMRLLTRSRTSANDGVINVFLNVSTLYFIRLVNIYVKKN
jgi:hypothetical protein